MSDQPDPTSNPTPSGGASIEDVVRTMTPDEQDKAANDPAFAQQMIDRANSQIYGTPATPPAPQPAFSVGNTVQDVVKGMTPTEQDKAANDPAFAQQMVDRHNQFSQQLASGVDPIATQNFQLWDWQQRVTQAPGFWDTVKAAGTGLVKGAAAAAEQTDEIGIRAASGDEADAAHQAADLGLVSGAKALAMNNSLVRDWDVWANKALTGIQKIGTDQQTSDYLDEQHRRFMFDGLVDNQADSDTAATLSKNAVSAVQALAPSAAVPALSSAAAATFGNTDVDQNASDFLSMLPQMAVEAGVARMASVAGASTSAAQAGVLSASYRAATDALADARAAHATAQATLTGAVTSGSAEAMQDAATWTKTEAANVAVREQEAAALQAKAAAAAQAASTDAAKIPAVRSVTGSIVSKVGDAISTAGKGLGALQDIPSDLAAKVTENPAAQALVAKSIKAGVGAGLGYVMGDSPSSAVGGGLLGGGLDFLGEAGAKGLQAVGSDLSRIGDIYGAGQATLPFWRNVRMAQEVSGFGKQIAAWMDNSAFDAIGRLGSGAVAGGAAAGGFGALLGAFQNPNDPVTGAAGGLGSGAVVGMSMGALGQWRSYSDPMQVQREAAGQLRIYQDSLAARPDEQKLFNRLDPADQTAIASHLMTRPDLKVRYIDDPAQTPGSYDAKALPDTVTVNLASKDPIADLVGHEAGHYIQEHQLGDFAQRQILGDANAGVPGDYTARDAAGEPIVNTAADGTKTYQPNAAFQQIQDRYVQAVTTTAQRRGWTPDQLNSTLAQVKDPAYIASEIMAEQHLGYLKSDQYRYDVKGIRSVNDVLGNNAALKNTLGAFGVRFDADTGKVKSPILGEFNGSRTIENMLRDYTRRQALGKAGDVEFTGGDTSIDEQALTKASGYAERYFNSSGEILRDAKGNTIYGPDGRATLRPRSAADAAARKASDSVIEAIDKKAASKVVLDPSEVQKRVVDGKTYYSGVYLPDEAIEAVKNSGNYNANQLDNLLQVNAELKAGFGREWNHFYQAATKKGMGNTARSLRGRWRTDLGYGWRVSKAENLLMQSVSLQDLQSNAARAVAKGEAKLWGNSLGDVLKDARTYFANVAAERPGETGLGDGAVAGKKKDFLQNLTGIRVKKYGDVNDLHDVTNAPKTIFTSLRLDRMNRVNPVADRNVPFSARSYERIAKNLTPERSTEEVEAAK